MHRATRYFSYSIMSLLTGFIICLFIDPSPFIHGRVFSIYGSMKTTFLPFGLFLSLAALNIYRASHTLPKKLITSYMNPLLKVISFLFLAIVLAPLNLSGFTYVTHEIAAFLLFSLEFVCIIYLVVKFSFDFVGIVYVLLALISDIAILLSTSYVHALSIGGEAQIASTFFFMFILVRSTYELEKTS